MAMIKAGPKAQVSTAGLPPLTSKDPAGRVEEFFRAHLRHVKAQWAGQPFVGALLNIELTSVGSWAERRSLAYTSYTDLSQKPEVCDLIQQEIHRVNRSLLEEPQLHGAQIHRFLMLHKELDPDDQEITRTRKVRRGFIAQKYGAEMDKFGVSTGAFAL